MPKFRYDKLVRDKIAQLSRDSGHIVIEKTLRGLKLKAALQQKILEEAAELPLQAHKDMAVIEEIADLQQVIDDICRLYGIDEAELTAAKNQKIVKRGGFLDGSFVETVEISDVSDSLVQKLRQDPQKYLEI